ncbi:MAG: cation:proton antiporter [Alphaproteobacteria bacterium CG11_big_fil_rev_8_21_14_0_20_44_7]|nr:MAG: cation:proton antiporter [Alphaproteobacteria bacterium CG11_big_fil_rev_8_21_14_0_20_44_7]
MMESSVLLIIALFLPFIAASGINLFSGQPNLREAVSLITSLILSVCLFEMGNRLLIGEVVEARLFEFIPGIALKFHLEPLGIIYALVAAILWFVTTIYSLGYMRANGKRNQTRFYIFFSIAIGCSLGIAFSANLFTMFIFYEALTFSTYPLVTHKGDEKSRKSGKIYLMMLVGASIAFFLPAIIWTENLAGTLEFTEGGILDQSGLSKLGLVFLLFLFVFGIGKAALMPMHRWLPAAMVAPTPVSALLHAVAVVKAGVFSITKIIFYIFGTHYLDDNSGGFFSTSLLAYIAAFTIICASIIAITKDNLKTRLAYSTIAQLSYIILAASIFSIASVKAAAMHIAAHAVAKITLFFSAGAFTTASGKKNVSELNGIGRKMPLVAIAFLISSLSMIGLPFLAGGESKLLIEHAAEEQNYGWITFVLYLSMVLNAIYYLPISYRAFFMKSKSGKEIVNNIPMQIAITITTIFTITYIFYMDYISKLLEML